MFKYTISALGALGRDEAVKGEDLTSIARAPRRQTLAHDREDEAVVEEGFEGSQVHGAAEFVYSVLGVGSGEIDPRTGAGHDGEVGAPPGSLGVGS